MTMLVRIRVTIDGPGNRVLKLGIGQLPAHPVNMLPIRLIQYLNTLFHTRHSRANRLVYQAFNYRISADRYVDAHRFRHAETEIVPRAPVLSVPDIKLPTGRNSFARHSCNLHSGH